MALDLSRTSDETFDPPSINILSPRKYGSFYLKWCVGFFLGGGGMHNTDDRSILILFHQCMKIAIY